MLRTVCYVPKAGLFATSIFCTQYGKGQQSRPNKSSGTPALKTSQSHRRPRDLTPSLVIGRSVAGAPAPQSFHLQPSKAARDDPDRGRPPSSIGA
jgi:hypothetical protein